MYINGIDVSSWQSARQLNNNRVQVEGNSPSIFQGRLNATSSVATSDMNDVKNSKPAEKGKKSKAKSEPQKVDKEYISTLQSGVSGLEYSIEENKVQKRGRVSMTGNAIDQFERNSKKLAGGVFSDDYNSTIRKIIGSKNENEPQNMLTSKYRKYKQNLSIDLAIYQDLAQKPETTDAEKKFMNNFEQRFQNYIDILSE